MCLKVWNSGPGPRFHTRSFLQIKHLSQWGYFLVGKASCHRGILVGTLSCTDSFQDRSGKHFHILSAKLVKILSNKIPTAVNFETLPHQAVEVVATTPLTSLKFVVILGSTILILLILFGNCTGAIVASTTLKKSSF